MVLEWVVALDSEDIWEPSSSSSESLLWSPTVHISQLTPYVCLLPSCHNFLNTFQEPSLNTEGKRLVLAQLISLIVLSLMDTLPNQSWARVSRALGPPDIG